MVDFFIVKWVLAFSPILTVLVLMIFRNWSGSRAGAAGWFVALIAASLVFGPGEANRHERKTDDQCPQHGNRGGNGPAC